MLPRILTAGLVISLALTGAAGADCGCTGVEVKYNTQANSVVQSTQYCVVDTQTYSECTEVADNPCGEGMKTYTCPIGGKSGSDAAGDWFGVGLEYILTGTDLNSCTNGLALQRNLTENGDLQDNGETEFNAPVGLVSFGGLEANILSGVGNDIPNVGAIDDGKAIFTSDNYSAVSNTQTIKINDANTQITFSDMPSVYLEEGDADKTVVQQDVFVVSVRNAAADEAALCGCQFQLTATKNAGGTALSTVALNQLASLNCTYTQVP